MTKNLRLIAMAAVLSAATFASADTTVTTVRDTDYELKGWDTGVAPLIIPCSDFIACGLAEGDVIKISYTAPSTGGSFKAIYRSNDGAWLEWPAFRSLPGIDPRYGTLNVSSPGAAEIPIDPAALKVVEENSAIIVQGMDVTITRVEILHTNPTAILEIEADQNPATQPEYYDLRGIRVSGPSGGIFLQKEGHSVKKVLVK